MAHRVQMLDQMISKGRQAVTFSEILKCGDHKLRIRIKSDSYDFQSSAIAERWDGAKWRGVYTIPYANMQTPHKLAYVPQSQGLLGRNFLDDREKLVEMTLKIIS